jgi:hypothetical protein
MEERMKSFRVSPSPRFQKPSRVWSSLLRLEFLEDRTLLNAGTVLNHPEAILRPDYGTLGVPIGFSGTSLQGGAGRTPPNVLVNNPGEDGNSAGDTQSETSLLLGPNNLVIASYNDSFTATRNQYTGYSISTDGGQTFTDEVALPANPGGDAGDPQLARDTTTGRIYFATLNYNNIAAINLYHSDNNGNTFSAPINAAPGLGHADKEWLAVDNNAGSGQSNVYLIVRDFGGQNGIFLFKSTNQGASFGPNRGVSIASANSFNVQGAWVTVGPDHTVYAFWYAGSSTPTIQMRKSTDQGQTFGAAVTVATLSSSLGLNGDLGVGGFRSNAFPQALVNPANPNIIYATFDNKGAGSQRADVFFTESTNGGATWSSPVSISNDTTTRDKWQPAIAVTPDGTNVGIFWYDRRNDPSNNLIDRYGTIGSVSGGTVTFGPAIRVSDTSFPPAFGHDPYITALYMGDYDQVQATNTAFYTTWGDNRSPSLGHAGNNQDVRFAQVPIQSMADATHFNVIAPSSVHSGDLFSITVQALDANGNLVPTYTGTVHFTSTDPQATLPADYTFMAADNGVHTFSGVILRTARFPLVTTITATDTVAGSITGSTGVRVMAAPATHFGLSTSAANPDIAGTPFDVIVTAQDPYGNTDTGYLGTVHFSSADPYGASLPADFSFRNVDQGFHRFPRGATLYTAGTWDVTATDTQSSITGSANVNVIAAAASQFVVSTDAVNPDIAGTVFDVTVVATDPYGNTDTNYLGTVHFSSADPYGASLPADYTFQASDQGMATVSGVTALYTAGTWDVTATDTQSGITGAAFVNVQAAPAVAFRVVAPASTTSGVAFDVTVIAVDPYGNTDMNYTGTIHFTTSDMDPGVVLPPDYTFQVSDAGMVTFASGVTLITPGDQTLTATDTLSGITGTTTVTVRSGPDSGAGGFGGKRGVSEPSQSATVSTGPVRLSAVAADAQSYPARTESVVATAQHAVLIDHVWSDPADLLLDGLWTDGLAWNAGS